MAITIAITVVGMWVLSALAIVIYTGGFRSATERWLVIPQGTSELIAAGANPLDIPREWQFVSGDILHLINDDDVGHWIGSWYVADHGRTTVELFPAYAGLLTCSIHPSGRIEIVVEPSGFDWRLTAFPALVLGLPLGLVVAGVGSVMGALKREETPEP